jgi:hypothetical protein
VVQLMGRNSPDYSPEVHQKHRWGREELCLWHSRLSVWRCSSLLHRSSRVCLITFIRYDLEGTEFNAPSGIPSWTVPGEIGSMTVQMSGPQM